MSVPLRQVDKALKVLTFLCYLVYACCNGHALSLLCWRTEGLDMHARGGNVKDGMAVYNTGLY